MKINIRQYFFGPWRSVIWGYFFLLLISIGVFIVASVPTKKNEKDRLERESSLLEDQIKDRFEIYSTSLLGIRSFVYNERSQKSPDLSKFIEDTELFRKYPGLASVGYADVTLSKKNRDLTKALVTKIYPSQGQAQTIPAFDLLSKKAWKKAAIISIHKNRPALSNYPVLQNKGKVHGSILFLPVYSKKKKAPKELENTKGLLFMSFHSSTLYSNILEEHFQARDQIGISLKMVSEGKEKTSIYENFAEGLGSNTTHRTFDILGQTFSLTVYPQKSFYKDYDKLFPYMISLLTLIVCALISINLRSNSSFAKNLGRTNRLLNRTLRQQKEKEEDLYILNRTLQKMSHSLDVDKITESFIQGVSEIFESKGKFAIYSTTKLNRDPTSYHLIISNDDAFFVSECKLQPKVYDKIFIFTDEENKIGETIDCGFLVDSPVKPYRAMFSRIDSSAFGANAFSVFVSTSGDIDETEGVLFEALTKHLNTSLQNTMLLKKVEDSNRSKTAFLANMSHEIRTPLNALMGFSEILTREDIDSKTKKKLSGNMIKNGRQLSRLVDDILDLSKIEAGKMVIEKKPTDIRELVDEIKTVMNMRLTPDSKVELKVEVNGEIPALNIDPLRLKQILNNLIGNAIKFTRQGFVRLRVTRKQETGKSYLLFRVEDTGIGIKREFRYKLFRPFSQADSTATRQHGGVGLGLAISKRLAKELGGELNLVFSEKDIGSVFELSIPIDKSTEIAQLSIPFKPTEKENEDTFMGELLKARKILLVEDSIDNQDFFRFVLSKAGAEVKIVSNGLVAVDEATRKEYDAILMDIQLPGIDGKEATRRIRAKGYRGPIIALTAHAMLAEQQSCAEAGCDGQITKPVSGNVLISRVSEFIKGNHEIT